MNVTKKLEQLLHQDADWRLEARAGLHAGFVLHHLPSGLRLELSGGPIFMTTHWQSLVPLDLGVMDRIRLWPDIRALVARLTVRALGDKGPTE